MVGQLSNGNTMVSNISIRNSKGLDSRGMNMDSGAYPPAWYLLWLVIAVCGVGTWFLRNFTERVEATRLVAFTGVAAMSAMVIWTFTQF